MKYCSASSLALTFTLGALSHTVALANENSASMSFQGFSGLINTPSAKLFDSGSVYLQYGNQVETHRQYHGGPNSDESGYRNGTNVNLGIGLWEYVEVSARLADYTFADDRYITDLSANVKLGIPYIPKNWFNLAIGIQDLGGARSFFNAKYAVASRNVFDNVEVSLGIGKSQSLQGRLNGIFTGVTWQPYNWLKLSAEYDAADTQVGLHLSSPKAWLFNDIQVSSDLLISSTNEELKDDFYYGIGLTIPLNIDTSQQDSNTGTSTNTEQSNFYVDIKDEESKLNFQQPTAETERTSVQKHLVEEGFEYVQVSQTDSDTLYVEVQNHIYNRNQIDGIGVVLGILSKHVKYNYENFEVIVKEREIPVLSVKGSLLDYVSFLRDNKPLKIAISTDAFSFGSKTVSTTQLDNTNNFWFKPRFTFWPGVVSRVGTEVGMFDSSIALVSHVEIPVWYGAAITAQYTKQVTESKNFEDGEYYEADKQETALNEYSFHQAFALPFNVKNMTSIGKYRDYYDYVSNEIKWQSNQGAHSVNLVTARYKNNEVAEVLPFLDCNILFSSCWPDPEPQEREIFVAKYRYYNAYLNTSARIQVGQYWQQDKGFKLELERMFGDVSVSLTYKNTKVNDDEPNQLVGLGFSIPLTPSKDYSNRYFQVRGKPKWNYSVNTVVGEESNDLTPGTADSAQQFYNIDSVYYNNDRLGSDYIYENTERLKKASYSVY